MATALSDRTCGVCCRKKLWFCIDGKRVAIAASDVVVGSTIGPAGVDINLIPFPMIDHIDILKDGASAVYGSDAVAGVINIFLLHKFRGLESGAVLGTQIWVRPTMRVSWRAGSRQGRETTRPISWSLPIFTIVPPYTPATATFLPTPLLYPGEDSMTEARLSLAAFRARPPFLWFSLDPEIVFQRELSAATLSA